MRKVSKLEDKEIEEILSLVMETFADNADSFHMTRDDMEAVITEEILFRLRGSLDDMELWNA